MAIVEAIIFLITPTLEIVVPFTFLVLEALFWLCVAFVAVLKALFTLSKPKMPKWQYFSGARGKVAEAAIRWRNFKDKRANKKKKLIKQ